MEFLQNIFARIRGWFAGIWDKTEKRDRFRFLVIVIVAVTLIIAASVMLSGARYTDLPLDANTATLRQAAAVLDASGIGFKYRANTLAVNKSDELQATALLAQHDWGPSAPKFAVYQEAMGLTNTAADRDKFSKWQTEENLERYLSGFEGIERAAVSLYLPDNTNALFSNEFKATTVAVILYTKAGVSLIARQIETVVNFVSNATGAAPENVVITDQYMTQMNRVAGDETTTSFNYELTRKYENDTAADLNRMFAMLFGPSHFYVTVHAKLNFDEERSQIETWTPVVGDDEGIVRSMETLSEMAQGSGWIGGEPGTDPDGLGEDYDEVDNQLYNVWERESQIINYDINRRLDEIVRAKGVLEEQTVSVLVDLNDLDPANNSRSAIQSLVGGTVGLLPSEYASRVVVQFMPMSGRQQEEAEKTEFYAAKEREQSRAFVQAIVLYIIIGLCVIILIWRTFAFLKPETVELQPEKDYLVGDLRDYNELVESAVQNMELEVTKSPTRSRVEDFIESHPEAVATMIRAWLQDEGDAAW